MKLDRGGSDVTSRERGCRTLHYAKHQLLKLDLLLFFSLQFLLTTHALRRHHHSVAHTCSLFRSTPNLCLEKKQQDAWRDS